MRTVSRWILLAGLVLTVFPALAQEAVDDSVPTWTGLGLGMIIVGLSVVAFIGWRMSVREAEGDEEDLV